MGSNTKLFCLFFFDFFDRAFFFFFGGSCSSTILCSFYGTMNSLLATLSWVYACSLTSSTCFFGWYVKPDVKAFASSMLVSLSWVFEFWSVITDCLETPWEDCVGFSFFLGLASFVASVLGLLLCFTSVCLMGADLGAGKDGFSLEIFV